MRIIHQIGNWKMKRKLVIIIFSFLIAIITMQYIDVKEYKNIGDYQSKERRNFWADMSASQEMFLYNTSKVSIYIVPRYCSDVADDVGINVKVSSEWQEEIKFVPLASLKNNELTTIDVILDKNFSGKATVYLESCGMTEENYVELIISNEHTNLWIANEGFGDKCIVMGFDTFSKLSMFIVFMFIFIIVFLFLNNTIPYLMFVLQNREWKKIVVLIIFSSIMSLGIVSLRQWVVVRKESVECVALNKNTVIEQELCFSGTNKIVLDCLISEEAIEKARWINVILETADSREEHKVNLNEYQSKFWDFIHIDTQNFSKGNVRLIIEGKGLEDEQILLQLVKGKQAVHFNPVKVNGVVKEGQLLGLRYDYLNAVGFLKIYIVIFCVSVLIISIYQLLMKYIENNIAIIVIAMLFLVNIIHNGIYNERLSGWCVTPWLMTYKYGFISRALPGTILLTLQRIFTGNTCISEADLRSVFLIMLFLLCVLMLYWFNKMLYEVSSIKNGIYYKSVLNLIYTYALSPVFISFYCYSFRLGRLDIILEICFIGCCYLIVKNKKLYLIPIFTSVAILTHQIFIFTLLPIILSTMIYFWIGKDDKRYAFPTICTFAINAVLGFYCQFKANIRGWTLQEIMFDMQRKTDASLLELMVSSEQFFSTQMFTDYYTGEYVSFGVIYKYIWFVLISIPIYLIYIYVWKESIKKNSIKTTKYYERVIKKVKVWNDEFEFSTYECPVRVIKSLEQYWHEGKEKTQELYIATNMLEHSVRTIIKIMHLRWNIENCGFRKLK